MSRRTSDKQAVTNRDVNAAQRAAAAVQLRAKKLTYEKIAAQCGYANAGTARKAILREMDRTIVRNVEQLRAEELLTLDTLQTECMTLFLDAKNKGRLFAADRILAIMERRAKLMGLDVPADVSANASVVIVREVPAGWIAEPVVEAAS